MTLAGCLGSDEDGASEVPALGAEDAAVTLEVYTDFACGVCAAYDEQYFEDIQTQYVEPGNVRYEHRDFIIPVADPGSWQAASAAREVLTEYGSQEFWEFKTRLLERYDEISAGPAVYGEIAEQMDLDSDGIVAAAEDRVHESDVEADDTRGQVNGVQGTPSFVVDGELIEDGETLPERMNAVTAAMDEAIDG